MKKTSEDELTYEEAKKPIHGIKNDYNVCNSCVNYLDDLFKNPNYNGCSKNPSYINCFTPIKD